MDIILVLAIIVTQFLSVQRRPTVTQLLHGSRANWTLNGELKATGYAAVSVLMTLNVRILTIYDHTFSTVVLTFCDWLQWLKIRPTQLSYKSAPHQITVSTVELQSATHQITVSTVKLQSAPHQITVSTVQLCLTLCDMFAFIRYGMRLSLIT
jgi:hypothetical protein